MEIGTQHSPQTFPHWEEDIVPKLHPISAFGASTLAIGNRPPLPKLHPLSAFGTSTLAALSGNIKLLLYLIY